MTDLTNTSWMFNEELNISRTQYPEYTSYAVEFTFSGKAYESLALVGDAAGGNMYFPHSSTTNSVVYSHGNWLVDGRIATFTGGEDATNADLIAFIQENAERVKTITDTIAEKLVIVAENEQKVYDAGYSKGHSKGYTEGESLGYENGKTDGYSEGYDAGKKAEYDAFWDALQNYGKRTEYSATFAQWSMEYIRPKYKVVPTSSNVGSLFNNNKMLLAVEKNYFDFSQITTLNADYICNACEKLLIFEDCGLPALDRYARCWRFCGNLHTIEVIRSNENTTFTYAFESCKSLENITIEGVIGQNIDFHWSTNLSYSSTYDIIIHLSDTTTGKTLTLSKTAVDEAFKWYFDSGDPDTSYWIPGSDESNPVWTPLRDSKPNWTITLV